MGKLTFVEHDGQTHEVSITPGSTLLSLALENDVPGIDADCGGACGCATCHVILTTEGLAQVGPPHEDEKQMLSLTPDQTETSRLACQVEISGDHAGMVVRLPEFQM